MVESELLEKLRDFLSTDIRRDIFFNYVFSTISPSEIVKKTKTPFSTVDRVTNTLRLMDFLIKVDGPDSLKNYYEVDLDLWLMENLKLIGLDFLDDEMKKEVLDIIGDNEFLSFSFILIDPDFVFSLYEEPLKIGNDMAILELMRLLRTESLISEFPVYIMLSSLMSPGFEKIKDIMFSDDAIKSAKPLIKEELDKYPFLSLSLDDVNKEFLNGFNEKRARLSLIMERLLEQKLQKDSMKRTRKKMI